MRATWPCMRCAFRGTGFTQVLHMQKILEQRLSRIPEEVERIVSRIGLADVANDPMPPSMTDTFVMMKPREVARCAQA